VAELMENFADPAVGCVSGELLLGHPQSGESTHGMGLYWSVEKKIRALESRSGSMVGATGALYAVRRNVMPLIPEDTILDDVYVPMCVARQGCRVIFEAAARAWDAPDLGAREFARKVRTLSGNYDLLQRASWMLSRENPIRFEFVSHKLLRLLVPFALGSVLLTSLFLSGPVYRIAFWAQLLFYALGALAAAGLKRGLLARVGDAAWTFVLLNTAAVVAFANFVTGRRALWSR
jgi:poly-beta-1,6-N-acetyl-D-glucosamine synthase